MFLLFKLVAEFIIHQAFVLHPSCFPEKVGIKVNKFNRIYLVVSLKYLKQNYIISHNTTLYSEKMLHVLG
jgi:hypothetical protein